MICAPWAAASRAASSCLTIIDSLSPVQSVCSSAAVTMLAIRVPSARGAVVLAVRHEHSARGALATTTTIRTLHLGAVTARPVGRAFTERTNVRNLAAWRAPRTPRELWDWILGRDPLPPVSPDKTVEAAWLPQWLSRIVTDELVAAGIPAVVVDDFNLNLTMYTREPMSRIFVTEDRRDEAQELVEEILGHPPRRRPL